MVAGMSDSWRNNVSSRAAGAHDRLKVDAREARSQSKKEENRSRAAMVGVPASLAAGSVGTYASLPEAQKKQLRRIANRQPLHHVSRGVPGTLKDVASTVGDGFGRSAGVGRNPLTALAAGGAAAGILGGAAMNQKIAARDSKHKAYRRDAVAGKIKRRGEYRARANKEAEVVGKSYLSVRVSKSLEEFEKTYLRFGAAAGGRSAKDANKAINHEQKLSRLVNSGSRTPGKGAKKYDPKAVGEGGRRGPSRAIDNKKGYQPGTNAADNRKKLMLYGGLGAGGAAAGYAVGRKND